MKIMTGNANRPLAEAISAFLNLPMTKASVRRCADMALPPIVDDQPLRLREYGEADVEAVGDVLLCLLVLRGVLQRVLWAPKHCTCGGGHVVGVAEPLGAPFGVGVVDGRVILHLFVHVHAPALNACRACHNVCVDKNEVRRNTQHAT